MILVSVGTTMAFDELIEEVDRLAGAGFFNGKVVCQIGSSAKYTPENCDWFHNKRNLETEFWEASLLIVHGGTGSTIQALISGVPFVSIANPRSAHDHQAEFLAEVAARTPIVWSRDWTKLTELIPQARNLMGSDTRSSVNKVHLSRAILDFARRV